MGLTEFTEAQALNAQLGQGGYDLTGVAGTINQTTNPNTEWIAITALVGCTLSALSVDTSLWDTLAAIEVPAGTTVYGRWSQITTGSGDTAICYRG